MEKQEFERLQRLQSELQEDPARLTAEFPEMIRLMNNFHMRLIGYMAKPAPGDDETMTRIINEHNKVKTKDMNTASKANYSDKFWNMSPSEVYQDVRAAIESIGYDPEELEKEIRYYESTGLKKPAALIEKMIAVYKLLRAMGYDHRELTQ